MAAQNQSDVLLDEMRQLHPSLIDLSLTRVLSLLEKLDNPHLKLPPVIHIAGTNGKGSVLAFLQAILEAHGQSVHRFTSPHLVRFHERVMLGSADGTCEISEEKLVTYLKRCHEANGDNPITFFEITTVMAFLAFAEHDADWCLLETGLGGRLDATNVIDQPAATIITPISIDHTGFLGNTLKEIAGEKAGILKQEVPAFIGYQEEAALEVLLDTAFKLRAPITVRGQDYDVFEQRGRLVYSTDDVLKDLPLPRHLIGRHQIENAGLALATAQHLLGDKLDQVALADAMETAFWPARLQRFSANMFLPNLDRDDEIWLDGGHNPAAASILAEAVGSLEERHPRPLHLIIGMMSRKDVRGFLSQFIGLAKQVITMPVPNADNGINPDTLADLAIEMGFEAESAASLDEALQISAEGRHHDARILICGSLYLAGHVLELVEQNKVGQVF